MKLINNYISEKLVINKQIKGQYNPDLLNQENIVLYKSEEDDWQDEDYREEIKNIEKNYSYFMCTKFSSLGSSKSIKGGYDPDNDIYDIQEYDLEHIVDNVITGKDLGYDVRLTGGHIEIDCINSGSRATYYIYSLSHETYDKLAAWWEGDEDVDNLKFLYQKGAIIPIEDK